MCCSVGVSCSMDREADGLGFSCGTLESEAGVCDRLEMPTGRIRSSLSLCVSGVFIVRYTEDEYREIRRSIRTMKSELFCSYLNQREDQNRETGRATTVVAVLVRVN